jgi:hypothetical protein
VSLYFTIPENELQANPFPTRVILSERSESKDLLAKQKIASIESAKIPRLHFIPLGMTR